MVAILECQTAKNQNGLMQTSLWREVCMIPVTFSSFRILLILVTDSNLTGLSLFNIEET